MSAAETLDLTPEAITQRRASAAEITQARAILRWWAGQRHAESNGYPAPLGEHRESTRSGVPSSRPPRGVSRGEEFGRFCALLEAARAINGGLNGLPDRMRLYELASAAALPAVGAEVLGFGAEQ